MLRWLAMSFALALSAVAISACSDDGGGGGGKSAATTTQSIGWDGVGIAKGSAITVNIVDSETGSGVADVQVICSLSDGTDLVSAESNAAGVARLQGFDELPTFLTVVDPTNARNITFYGNEQFPLRTHYTVPVHRPVAYTIQFANPPASVGFSATLGAMVNGTDISSSIQMVDGVRSATISSGNAFTKGKPVMVLSWWEDDLTGELLDVHYFANFTGITEDTTAIFDLSVTENFRDDLNNVIGRADWTDPPEPEPEPDPDPMDTMMDPAELEPELVRSRIWGDVLVPTRETGVDVTSNGTYVWVEMRNSFGTWRIPGSFESTHAANTRFNIWAPRFQDSDSRIRMTPERVFLGLGFSTVAPSGDITLQVSQPATAYGRAADFNLSAMVLDDAAVEVTLGGLNMSTSVTSAQANLVAKIAENVTIRSSSNSTSESLTFPWLTGVSQAPLAPIEAVLVSGWSTLQFADGRTQGIAYTGQDSIPLIGEFNLDGSTEGLTADLSPFVNPSAAPIDAQINAPATGSAFVLGQDKIRWSADGVNKQDGFFTIWIGGDLGADDQVDLEWQMYVPVMARETQDVAAWAVSIPYLSVAELAHQPSANDNAVRLEIGFLDVTRSKLTASSLTLAPLLWSAESDMDYIGRENAIRSFRLPVQTGVDIQ